MKMPAKIGATRPGTSERQTHQDDVRQPLCSSPTRRALERSYQLGRPAGLPLEIIAGLERPSTTPVKDWSNSAVSNDARPGAGSFR